MRRGRGRIIIIRNLTKMTGEVDLFAYPQDGTEIEEPAISDLNDRLPNLEG